MQPAGPLTLLDISAAGRNLTNMTYDRAYWEALWTKTLREHADVVARRPPNAHLVGELQTLSPGRALDAGCGHGAESIWLAAHGWNVTALDFSASALGHARARAEAMGTQIAARIEWLEGDLGIWSPPRDRFDLVVCCYVHIATSEEEMVSRMASGVAPGGTLFMVGHRPIDPATGNPTAAAGQLQISVEAARAALGTNSWDFIVAEERPRAIVGTGVDAVIRARRTR